MQTSFRNLLTMSMTLVLLACGATQNDEPTCENGQLICEPPPTPLKPVDFGPSLPEDILTQTIEITRAWDNSPGPKIPNQRSSITVRPVFDGKMDLHFFVSSGQPFNYSKFHFILSASLDQLTPGEHDLEEFSDKYKHLGLSMSGGVYDPIVTAWSLKFDGMGIGGKIIIKEFVYDEKAHEGEECKPIHYGYVKGSLELATEGMFKINPIPDSISTISLDTQNPYRVDLNSDFEVNIVFGGCVE